MFLQKRKINPYEIEGDAKRPAQEPPAPKAYVPILPKPSTSTLEAVQLLVQNALLARKA